MERSRLKTIIILILAMMNLALALSLGTDGEDPQRLEALYLEGRKAMLDNLPALREFLEQ